MEADSLRQRRQGVRVREVETLSCRNTSRRYNRVDVGLSVVLARRCPSVDDLLDRVITLATVALKVFR